MSDVYRVKRSGYILKLESEVIRFVGQGPIRQYFEVVICGKCRIKCACQRDALGYCHIATCHSCLNEYMIQEHKLTDHNRFRDMRGKYLNP